MRLIFGFALLSSLSACWEEDTGLKETGEADTDDSDTDADSDIEIDIQHADAMLFGEKEHGHAGKYSAIGDINDDGFDDIGISSGSVYLFNGPLSGEKSLNAADVILEVAEDESGLRITIGEVSGDNIEDLILGVCNMDNVSGINSGGVYVANGPLTGNIQLDESANARLYGENLNDDACHTYIADLNGDEIKDVLVGSVPNDEGAGVVYLLYGPVSGELELVNSDAKLIGEAEEASVGGSLSAADVDGDGLDDVLLTSPNGLDFSTAHFFYGPVYGTYGLDSADVSFSGDDCGFYNGPMGDVSGDGYSDVFIGTEDGIFIFQGPLTGEYSVNDANMSLICSEEVCGDAIVGDLDGDGVMEIVIGNPYERPGEVYISYDYIEGSNSISSYAFKYVGDPEINDLVGSTMLIGDVDGDLLGDLIIGDHQASHNVSYSGALYLMYGAGFQDLL